MNAKVSILVPVFNRAAFIAECISSAQNQTYSNIEIIVVDNCSNDGTWEICESFASIDSRVKAYRNEKNIGPVRNWMRCVLEANGEYSKILFSDDKLSPRCIELMVNRLNSSDIGMVYSVVKMGVSEEDSIVAYASDSGELLDRDRFIDLIVRGLAPYSPGALMIRTEDLRKNLKYEFNTSTPHNYIGHGAGPDLMIALLTIESYKYVAFISEPLVFFRSHKGSLSVQNVNNEIQYSYWSVMSWHLKGTIGQAAWMDYLAYIWLLDVRRKRTFKSLRAHLKQFEGSGNINEVFALIRRICFKIAEYSVKKIHK